MWWQGPTFIYNLNTLPKYQFTESDEIKLISRENGHSLTIDKKSFYEEIKSSEMTNVNMVNTEYENTMTNIFYLNKFSDLSKVYRITGSMLRFINNLKKK